MVFGKILVEKLKAKGVKDAEVVAMDAFGAFKEAAVDTIAHPEAETTERAICGVAVPVLTAFEPSMASLVDFNKDGKIG